MKNTRKAGLAILVGVTVTGVVGAAAASFNGFDADTLGSESTIVAACDENGISVGFTTDFVDGDYEVTSVVFSAVEALCDDKAFDVTLTDGDGDSLASQGGTVGLTANSFSVAVSGVLAEDVEGVSLVISG